MSNLRAGMHFFRARSTEQHLKRAFEYKKTMEFKSIAATNGDSIAVRGSVDGYTLSIVANPVPGYGEIVYSLKHVNTTDFVWRLNMHPVTWRAGENNPRYIKLADESMIVHKFKLLAAAWGSANKDAPGVATIATAMANESLQ